MPELTMMSAVCWTRDAETLQPNEFQSFQPIGGVSARPLPSADAGVAVARPAAVLAATARAVASRMRRIVRMLHLRSLADEKGVVHDVPAGGGSMCDYVVKSGTM